jgi:hypothetical protein
MLSCEKSWWIVEFSPSQKCLHIEEESSRLDVTGDWRQIVRKYGTHGEIVEWCNRWKRNNINRGGQL